MSVDSPEFQPVFIRFRGRTQGPFGLDQLLTLNKRGQFGRAYEISVDRLSWRSAATLEAVFPPSTKKPKSLAKSADMDATIEIDTNEIPLPSPKPAKPVWHYSVGTETYGPITLIELRGLLANGQLNLSDPVWKDGMADWLPAGQLPELQNNLSLRTESHARSNAGASNFCFACGAATDSRAELCPKCGVRQAPLVSPKSRIVTALFAIFLGTFGIHRFYLGQPLLGLAYPISCCVLTLAGVIMFVQAHFLVAIYLIGLSSIPSVIAFIEGIVFLCTSDSSFARAHNTK